MSLTVSVAEIVENDFDPLLAIHPSWSRVPLGEVAEVTNGAPFKSKLFNSNGEGLPLIRIRNVVGGSTDTFTTEPFDERYRVEAGDLLVGMDGDFNSSRWTGREALLNQRVCKIEVTSDRYEPRFLDHVLPGYLAAIHRNTSSMTVKHLSSRSIESIPLPLPPLEEQRMIADKLEELFSDLDAGEAALRDAKARLVRYRQSVLNAAVTGDLTAEWRAAHPDAEPAEALLARISAERREAWEADTVAKYAAKGTSPPKTWKARYTSAAAPETDDLHELPDGWGWTSADYVCAGVESGSTPPPSQMSDSGDVPFLKVYNLTKTGELDFTVKPTWISRETHEAKLWRSRITPGNVLMNIVGPPLGKVSLVPGTYPEWNTNQAVAVFRPLSGVLNRYLLTCLLSAQVLKPLLAQAKATAGQFNIGVTMCRGLAIPLPSEAEQAVIVEEVERRLSVADAVAADVDAQLARSKRLRRSILQRAFEGRLVPQSASVPVEALGRQTTLAL